MGYYERQTCMILLEIYLLCGRSKIGISFVDIKKFEMGGFGDFPDVIDKETVYNN